MEILKENNDNICLLNDNIDHLHLRHLINNCVALREKKFIYTDHRRNFSVIFVKSSSHDNQLFYHYYRVHILEPTERGKEEKKYELEETWGTFESSDYWKHTKKYLRDAAVETFFHYTSGTYVDDKFFTIISLSEKKRWLDDNMEKLLKNIINSDLLVKIMQEYQLDVRNIRKKFMRINLSRHNGTRMVINDVDIAKMFASEDVDIVMQSILIKLLDKGIDCRLNHRTNKQVVSFWSIFYQKLGTKINALDPNTDKFAIIQKYVKNTHSPHHGTFTLNVQNVFNIERPDDRGLFIDQIGNKKLLWHGTKKSNIASILLEGFKVSEVPLHGRMFGRGIYFSNSVSKAANYCGCSQKNTEGYLLLCEVALGNTMELYRAQKDLWTLPLGIHSVIGKGRFSPYLNDVATIYQDVQVPYGKIVENVFSPNTGLIHDEFIVFTASQIRIRYLVAVKFEFKN